MMPNDVKNELEPLLARCASGEAAALKLLYKNTAAQLFGVLRRILLRDDLAQEALQDVYVSVWRNAKVTSFPTHFADIGAIAVENGKVYGNIVVNTTGAYCPLPTWSVRTRSGT